MFGKLLKHEFRATGRVALPLLGGMLVLAVMSHLALYSGVFGRGMVGSAIMILYFMSFFAVGVGVVVMTVLRFRGSVLGDEGYLTMTLPVSLHAILASKVLTAVAWYALSLAAIALSVMIAGMGVDDWSMLPDILSGLRGFLRENAGGVALALADMLAMAVQATLLFYAAMSIGHSFNRHKGLLSVVSFFVLNGALRALSLRVIYLLEGQRELSSAFLIQRTLAPALGVILLCAAVLYAVTWWCLRRRLNLE